MRTMTIRVWDGWVQILENRLLLAEHSDLGQCLDNCSKHFGFEIEWEYPEGLPADFEEA